MCSSLWYIISDTESVLINSELWFIEGGLSRIGKCLLPTYIALHDITNCVSDSHITWVVNMSSYDFTWVKKYVNRK